MLCPGGLRIYFFKELDAVTPLLVGMVKPHDGRDVTQR